MDAPPVNSTAALLLDVARLYGIQARQDELQQALVDPEHGQLFAEWANLHLGHDNLLTPQELAQYTALDKNGHVDKLAALHDLSEIQAVSEGDIDVAIGELKRSTEAISKQSETMRQQQDALSRFAKKQAENNARRQDLDTARQRKAETERKTLDAEIGELSHDVQSRVSELEQEGEGAGTNLKQTLGDIFDSDDKLLSSLQKLGWELDQPDPAETQSVEQLREICMRLIKITVEGVRTKLDTVYMESLVTAERSGRARPATVDEVNSLQAEVDSLYSEILPVSQMSVEQQYLEPALKSVRAQGGQTVYRTAVALRYINECLDYLLGRVGRLQDRLEAHKSHQAAAAALSSRATAELSTPMSDERPATTTVPESPVRRRSPVRNRANAGESRARRRSSGVPEEVPIESLFQALGLPLALYEEDDVREQIDILSRTLAQRSAKCDEIESDAHESFERNALAYLQEAKRAIQLLRDSVFAETPFGQAKLLDQELDSSISVLEQEVDKAKEKLSAVDKQKGDGSSEKRQELLQRWGR